MTFPLKSKLFAVTFIMNTVAATLVSAGPLATTNRALNDGFGPDAGRWHGSVAIAVPALPIFGHTLTAQVDWAAFYRPLVGTSKFQLFLNDEGIAQADPSAPGEVLYAYQIVSLTAATPGVGTLSVGVDLLDGRGLTLPPAFVPTGAATEVAPSGGGDTGTSMEWYFNSPAMGVDKTSPILVFTSPFAPEFDFLQVSSGLASPSPSPLVASPSDRLVRFDVPEPSSMVLGLLCSVGLLLKGRKSR